MADRFSTALEPIDAALAESEKVRAESANFVPTALQERARKALARWVSK